MSTGITTEAGHATVPLREAVDILDSHRIPVNSTEREKRQGQIPYYGATGQVGWIDTPIFDEELVLLGEDGAPFLDPTKPKAYLIRGKSWVSNHAHVLRAKPGLLNSFLLYQLNNLDYRPYVSGTTRLKLPQGPMKQIPVLVPPEREQQRIVAEIEKQFTRLEAGVAALKRVQANLERYRAAVLKAACEGKLVPTEAELARKEGRPFETGAQLLARILSARREAWEKDQKKNGRNKKYVDPKPPDTSNLPRLPDGWAWATAEQLTDPVRSITYGVINLGDSVENGIPVLRSSDVRSLQLGLGNVKRVSPRIAARFKRTFLQGDEVLVTVRGTLGGVVVIPRECSGFNISREVAMLALVDSGIARATSIFIASPRSQAWLLARTKGIAYTGINIETLKSLPIPIPPLAAQLRIFAEVERRLSAVKELEKVVATNLSRASRLRQSILHAAFSGGL
ncbi:MAG: restriction endonuclease subunit S [Nitrospirae bacterium]|nr:restriction endonuclease subunit S [Nitrospirota bacterium]